MVPVPNVVVAVVVATFVIKPKTKNYLSDQKNPLPVDRKKRLNDLSGNGLFLYTHEPVQSW